MTFSTRLFALIALVSAGCASQRFVRFESSEGGKTVTLVRPFYECKGNRSGRKDPCIDVAYGDFPIDHDTLGPVAYLAGTFEHDVKSSEAAGRKVWDEATGRTAWDMAVLFEVRADWRSAQFLLEIAQENFPTPEIPPEMAYVAARLKESPKTNPSFHLTRKAWDGKDTLSCGRGDQLLVEGVQANLANHAAVVANFGCTLVLRNCDITGGPTNVTAAVDAERRSVVYVLDSRIHGYVRGPTMIIEGGSIDGPHVAVLEIRDAEVHADEVTTQFEPKRWKKKQAASVTPSSR